MAGTISLLADEKTLQPIGYRWKGGYSRSPLRYTTVSIGMLVVPGGQEHHQQQEEEEEAEVKEPPASTTIPEGDNSTQIHETPEPTTEGNNGIQIQDVTVISTSPVETPR